VIVPSIQGAGMVYGDRYGVGVATCRNETGWTPPSTIKIAGGSFSRQIFHGTSSLVLLVMSESAAYRLTQSPLVVLEGTATMGPVGPAFVDFCTLGCFDIFAYGWSNNMYIDVPLEGAIIRAADDVNQTIYGTKVSQAEILTGHVPMPPAAVPLVGAVSTYSGGVLEAY
jgi:lipid-binding SYLF domain-containing protein